MLNIAKLHLLYHKTIKLDGSTHKEDSMQEVERDKETKHRESYVFRKIWSYL